MAQYDGTTTNNWFTILEAGGPSTTGLIAIGAVMNTGTILKSMSIRLTVENAFDGTSGSDVFLLLGGDVWSFNTFQNPLLGVNPLYRYVKIEVKSTVVNVATDFKSSLVEGQ